MHGLLEFEAVRNATRPSRGFVGRASLSNATRPSRGQASQASQGEISAVILAAVYVLDWYI